MTTKKPTHATPSETPGELSEDALSQVQGGVASGRSNVGLRYYPKSAGEPKTGGLNQDGTDSSWKVEEGES